MKTNDALNDFARDVCREIEQFIIDGTPPGGAPLDLTDPAFVMAPGTKLLTERLLREGEAVRTEIAKRRSQQMASTPMDQLSIDSLDAAGRALLAFLGRAPKPVAAVKSKKPKPETPPQQ